DDLLAHPGLRVAHRVDEVHPAQDLQLGTAEVDAVAAGAQRGRPLDDGDVGAVAGQPVRERRPGDARAADQDVHGSPFARKRGRPYARIAGWVNPVGQAAWSSDPIASTAWGTGRTSSPARSRA